MNTGYKLVLFSMNNNLSYYSLQQLSNKEKPFHPHGSILLGVFECTSVFTFSRKGRTNSVAYVIVANSYAEANLICEIVYG